jgi:hypothetical protein
VIIITQFAKLINLHLSYKSEPGSGIEPGLSRANLKTFSPALGGSNYQIVEFAFNMSHKIKTRQLNYRVSKLFSNCF